MYLKENPLTFIVQCKINTLPFVKLAKFKLIDSKGKCALWLGQCAVGIFQLNICTLNLTYLDICQEMSSSSQHFFLEDPPCLCPT